MSQDIRTQGQRPQPEVQQVPHDRLTESQRIAAGILPNGQRRKQTFGAQSQKLAWPEIPGFKLYWANDIPGRIDELKERGWVHVEKDGKPVERIVGRNEGGDGLKAYLLKIREEWYNEDVSAAQSAEAEKMRAIKEGRLHADAGANQYVPAQGIHIERR